MNEVPISIQSHTGEKRYFLTDNVVTFDLGKAKISVRITYFLGNPALEIHQVASSETVASNIMVITPQANNQVIVEPR